jgi:hypothetical protein
VDKRACKYVDTLCTRFCDEEDFVHFPFDVVLMIEHIQYSLARGVIEIPGKR